MRNKGEMLNIDAEKIMFLIMRAIGDEKLSEKCWKRFARLNGLILEKRISSAHSLMGSIGGKAIAKKLGKKGMSELGKKGALKRWSNKK